MAERYRNTFYSIAGVLWQVDIMDANYSSTVSVFKTSGDGFRHSYRNVSQRMDSVLASDLSFNFIVETVAHQNFILEVIGAQEQRFGVKVYKNGALYFVGIIVNDGIEIEDAYYPYEVSLKFTDGIGRLSDMYYNQGGSENSTTPYTGRDTVIAHILKCLSFTGTVQYYGLTDSYLKIVCNWYEYHHVLSRLKCPLEDSNIDHKTFFEYDDKGVITWPTVYDVLVDILQTWNMRIFMANGIYHIIQVQEYCNLAIKSWTFYKSGSQKAYTYPDTSSYQVNTSSLTRMSGGVSKYMPPLGMISRKYKYKYSNGDGGNLLPVQTSYTSATALLNGLQASLGEYLHFEGNIHETYVPPGSPYTFEVTPYYKIKIVLTTSGGTKYYLTNANGSYDWSTSSSAYVLFSTPTFNLQWNMASQVNYDFVTAQLPAAGTATFQCYFSHFLYSNGTTSGAIPSGVFNSYYEQFKLCLEAANNQLNGEIKYWCYNGYNPYSTSKIEIKESVIGDGPQAYSLGRIECYNGSIWQRSLGWGIGQPPPTYTFPIHQFAVIQNINGQQVATEVFQGSFNGTAFSPEKAIKWGSKIFVAFQIDINPVEDTVYGRWFNAVIPVL